MSDEAVWLLRLKALGRSQGFLTYAQFNDSLPIAIVDPLEIEEIVERLKDAGIKVVPNSPDAGN